MKASQFSDARKAFILRQGADGVSDRSSSSRCAHFGFVTGM